MSYETAPNAKRLLWAGFFSIFAAGVGFGVRGSILVDWAREYGFTQKELGDISGGGLAGFGFIIIFGGVIADKLGYGKLMIFAFVMHVLSAALQICTPLIFDAGGDHGREWVYWSLTIAMYMFSAANGTCEVVVNPMVAALFPQQKTHYLNILHAGWPGGLIAGGVIGYFKSEIFPMHWIVAMSLFLVPVMIYGVMMVGRHLPRSEASQAGISFGTMLAEFAAPLLLLLLFIHALVGYVELGTDSWIQKITGTITASAGTGILLFIYTNILMFTLRFFAGPIESRLSPLGLLFTCAVIAAIGLTLLGNAVGVLMCLLAVSVYGVGKTFFWPTMLAVVSERFPRGGAVTLSAIGGVGMLSAGFLGSPGIGFQQDHFASAKLQREAPSTFSRYAVDQDKVFLGVFRTRGLDGARVGLLELQAKINRGSKEGATQAAKNAANGATEELNKTLKRLRDSTDAENRQLAEWFDANKQYVPMDEQPVEEAGLFGSRMALKWTAVVPATMAVLYLLIILGFKLKGGYKPVHLDLAGEATAGKGWTDEA
jgi:MFS family permease